MTSGSGTIYVPKDILFENLLKKEFKNKKFEKILYYDACVVVKNGKKYGKIIICDDSVYSFIDAVKKFACEAHFKDIYSIEIISDLPDFIFGSMKDKNIHIRIKFYKRIPQKIEVARKSQMCCVVPQKVRSSMSSVRSNGATQDDGVGANNNNSTIELTKSNTGLISHRLNEELEHVTLVEDSINFYILNIHSEAFHLLKRARTDYLIRESLLMSQVTVLSNLNIHQSTLYRLFDNLILDMTSSKNSLANLNDYLLELLESGQKYTRIKILFWSKRTLFQFLVSHFSATINDLITIDRDGNNSVLDNTSTKNIYPQINCLNILLQVFNVFFFETDHLETKLNQLRADNGKWSFMLLKNILSLVSYLNECDQRIELTCDLSDIQVEVDCLKHSVTVGSIQLFYHLISSSEVSNHVHEVDPFSIRTVVLLLESLITYDSADGIFNRFVNHSLQMLYIWLFPAMFKCDDQTLTVERVITVYQFFSSLRTIVQCVPKFTKFYRQEMEEEFEHFVLNDLVFPADCPLTSPTLKLLKSFQKNILDTKDIFIDYY